jgi:DNA topoisomerase-3
MAGYDHDDCDFAGGSRGGRGGTRVLMVAEKPSICNSIAQHLAPGGLDGGYRGSPPVHEFEGTFRGKPVTFVVTSVVGHVFSIDFPPAYQNWDTVDPVSLFSAPVTKKAEKGHIVKHLQELAVGVEYLVLWLDCDREGENICFEVITCCHSKMRHVGGQQVFRAKFSAIAKVDIERAMLTLVEPNENESLAVDARQELDLKVGVAFSRFQTKYFQGKYGDLDAKLVSYGPCQTPTLGFCVDRHDEIACFEPEDFWVLEVNVHKGAALLLNWERERLFDQGAARVFENLVRSGGAPPPDGAGGARVDSVSAKEGRRGRPAPLNTVEMLKVASKALGLGPHEAMRTAESLYLQGWMTYPRTESTAYPASFDIVGTLEAQRAHCSWGGYVAALLAKGVNRAKHGVDMGDHPPITPVRVPRPGDLSGAMERLYNVVARTFIASVSYDATFLTTTARFSCGGEHFSLSGKKLLDPGFTLIMESSAIRDTQLPAFDVGEVLELRAVGVRAGKTSPPGYLTEADLIGLMEQHGIGTDASIATHINNICQRNYVYVGSGRTLVPNPLGIVLVHGYHKIDPGLVLPRVRAAIEGECAKIASGERDKASVVAASLDSFERKFMYFVEKIGKMDALFEATFSPLDGAGKPLSKCGKCRRWMTYIPLKPQRLHCEICNETYALPQNGTIKLAGEQACPLDGFHLVSFSLGNTTKAVGKSYNLCPFCYNNPPFEGMTHMGCNSCLHPTCEHGLLRHAVCMCPGSSDATGGIHRACPGVLALDPNSRPNWKVGCNTCHTLLLLKGGIVHKACVSPKGRKCEDCGAKLLDLVFLQDKTPLEDGETKYSGCVICDDLISSMVEMKAGRQQHEQVARELKAARGRRREPRGPRPTPIVQTQGKYPTAGKKRDPKMTFEGF